MYARLTFSPIACFALGLAFWAGETKAEVNELFNRIPPGANCLVWIDVESLVNSKLGKQEDWRGKLKDAYSTKPIVVPPNATQVISASWLNCSDLEPLWEVSLIQVSKPLSMERIAKDTSGFSEALGDKMAAWSPMNAYFVRLDKTLLGVVSPADRQFASRWSVQSSASDVLSPYLRSAAGAITARTGYMFALDLQNAVSPKRMRGRIETEEFDCLTGKKADAMKISEAVAAVRGLTLSVSVDDDISGACTIDFDKPVAPLAAVAKPLVMECLDKAGASIADFGSWKFTTKDNAIVASGKLTTEGLGQLVSVVNPPSPAATDGDEQAGAGSSNAQAAASKRYYRAVQKTLDGFGKRVQSASSLSKGATYVARDARNIGRLPILNVDPELVRWGAGVSSRVLEVASAFGAGGLQARSRAESIANPNISGGVSYGMETHSDPNDEINRQNAARQRRAAVAEEKAAALKQATQVLMDLEAGSSQIRAAMTQKYKIDF